jgi:RHS repeat-associated protein
MNWISCHLSQRFHYYITDHLGSVRAILDSQGNIKSTHDFEPYGVELQPLSAESTNFKYKFTGQERDYSTNLDYMHFRFYASTMGRFLKPDSVIPNPANPQSWNLYSYVNGNPVIFNDPLGHSCPASIGTSPALYMERSSANWINWGALTGFYSNLYGGNVAFGGGAGGGEGSSQSGYWQPVYDTTMTTSDTVVWSDELGAWVGGDVTVAATQVGIVWMEYGGGSGTSGSSAIGAIRELAGVFLKESFNFGNRWPRYVFSKQSCYDYAYDLKERITNQHLEYWKAKVYVKETYFFGSESPYGPAHFSIVLEPINGNPLPNVWIDFYTYPQIQLWAYPHEWVIGPVRFSFHED